MRTIVKVAIGTALGILLAAAVIGVTILVLLGRALGGQEKQTVAAEHRGAPHSSPADDSVGDAPPLEPVNSRSSASRRRNPTKKKRAEVSLTSCDANIRVKAATTTCGFAQNVFYEYWSNGAQDVGSMPVWSPAVGGVFATTCVGDVTVVCRTDDGGEVRFSMAAVTAYDQAQADRYAATHDLGPRSAPSGDDESSVAGDSECDPNYAGACLDPSAYDYDCEGGSGDGPEYTGEVEVVGDDPYDLDRDGDGMACDS